MEFIFLVSMQCRIIWTWYEYYDFLFQRKDRWSRVALFAYGRSSFGESLFESCLCLAKGKGLVWNHEMFWLASVFWVHGSFQIKCKAYFGLKHIFWRPENEFLKCTSFHIISLFCVVWNNFCFDRLINGSRFTIPTRQRRRCTQSHGMKILQICRKWLSWDHSGLTRYSSV